MPTGISIGTGAGGVGRADVYLKACLTFLTSSDAKDFIISNVESPAYVQALNLVNGDNTITVPATAGGVVIIPPSENNQALKLKGAAGDTGVLLARSAPTFLPFHSTPPANFILNWPGVAGPPYNATAVTADNATDLLTLAAHALVAGDRVQVGGTTVPTGLTADTWYYVVTPLANTFALALTLGGAAINFTTDGVAVTISTPREFTFVWV